MKNIKLCLFILLLVLCTACREKSEPSPINFTAKAERIIITTHDWAISYVIAFTNNSDKNIVLYCNSTPQAKKFEQAGIMMQNTNFETPIGAFIPKDNLIYVNAQSTNKYFFVYSRANLNRWLPINYNTAKADLKSIVKNTTLSYNYKADVLNRYYKNPDIDTYYVFNKDFTIQKNGVKIEIKEGISIDEMLAMVNMKKTEF